MGVGFLASGRVGTQYIFYRMNGRIPFLTAFLASLNLPLALSTAVLQGTVQSGH